MLDARKRAAGLLVVKVAATFVLLAVAAFVLSGCSPAPARNRVTPGTASVERTIEQPSRWRIEIRQPPRVYVPTEAEEVDDDG